MSDWVLSGWVSDLEYDPSPGRRREVMESIDFRGDELEGTFVECLGDWGIWYSSPDIARSISIEGLVRLGKADALVEAVSWGWHGGETVSWSDVVTPILWAVRDCEDWKVFGIESTAIDALWHLHMYKGAVITMCLKAAQADENARVRKVAVQVLSRWIGPDEDNDASTMIDALKDRDAKVRREAAQALARFKGGRVTRALIEALGDADSEVRVNVANSLMKVGTQEVTEPLITALNDVDPAVRAAAAQALGVVGDSRAEFALMRALGDGAPEVRAAAAVALGKLHVIKALDQLCRQLGADDEAKARTSAAEALGCLGGKVAFQALRRALDDHGYGVCEKVEHAICEILRRNEEDKDYEPEAMV